MNRDEQPEVVDVHGAARIVGLSAPTLATMRCRGGGRPYLRLGRAIRYRVADLRAWRDAHAVRSTADALPVEIEPGDEPGPIGRARFGTGSIARRGDEVARQVARPRRSSRADTRPRRPRFSRACFLRPVSGVV